jgi:hypothetical protein
MNLSNMVFFFFFFLFFVLFLLVFMRKSNLIFVLCYHAGMDDLGLTDNNSGPWCFSSCYELSSPIYQSLLK